MGLLLFLRRTFMGLTVAEKEHWKERIAKRIDNRIETMVAKENPDFLRRTAEEARAKALRSLGIDSQQRELEEIEKKREEMQLRERRLKAEQNAAIKGTHVEEEIDRAGYYYDHTVDDAVRARASALEAEILASSDLGRRILALRTEKDNLLDTVWLATSSSQIKELWEHANKVLEVTPTTLEEKALRIAPVQEGQ